MSDDEVQQEGQASTAATQPVQPSSLSVGGLRFQPPKHFDGRDGQFEEWAYKLKAYLSLVDERFMSVMNKIEKYENRISMDEFLDEGQRKMSFQLQNMLISLTEGPAAKMVHREEQECNNGFESWRLLHRRYSPLKRARATNRLTKIINWTFKENDLETSFNEWETETYRLDSEQSQPLSDEVKIGILIGRI